MVSSFKEVKQVLQSVLPFILSPSDDVSKTELNEVHGECVLAYHRTCIVMEHVAYRVTEWEGRHTELSSGHTESRLPDVFRFTTWRCRIQHWFPMVWFMGARK